MLASYTSINFYKLIVIIAQTPPFRIFQINLIQYLQLMSESERESATVHSDTHESCSNLTLGANKKKLIKKPNQNHQVNAANKMTKEERMRIQKEKNREAAQRSRDQHKEYVNNLERQVKYLKEQIEVNTQYCFKCRQELNNPNQFYDEECKIDQELLFSQGRNDEEGHAFPVKDQEAEEYFLRPKEEEQEYSYIKMMLFVAMIVVAVLVFPSGDKQMASGRNLVELYKAPVSAAVKDDFTIVSPEETASNVQEIGSDLVVRNSLLNQQCLDSLIDGRSLSLANLRTAQMSYEAKPNQGILLCSFQQSKSPSLVPSSSQKSAILKLFLIGTEIKQMLTSNFPIKSFIKSNLQLNGIYRVAAEIKEVELISHHNCLL